MVKRETENDQDVSVTKENVQENVCGLIMPISGFDNYSASHWGDVRAILSEAAMEAGYEARMVSEANDVGVIHTRIIQNIYSNEIVICDVSGKNPNVMFELGMRLAFDRPTVIVKDEATAFLFDTSPIEHLEYPRDLRFQQIVNFKIKLAEKISATVHASKSDPEHSTFLRQLGAFKVAKIEQTEVTGQEFIIEQLKSLKDNVDKLIQGSSSTLVFPQSQQDNLVIGLNNISDKELTNLVNFAKNSPGVTGLQVMTPAPGITQLYITTNPGTDKAGLTRFLTKIARNALQNAIIN